MVKPIATSRALTSSNERVCIYLAKYAFDANIFDILTMPLDEVLMSTMYLYMLQFYAAIARSALRVEKSGSAMRFIHDCSTNLTNQTSTAQRYTGAISHTFATGARRSPVIVMMMAMVMTNNMKMVMSGTYHHNKSGAPPRDHESAARAHISAKVLMRANRSDRTPERARSLVRSNR